MNTEERNRLMRERKRAELLVDFEPFYAPEMPVSPEMRLAIAGEYAAFQLGQINRKLDSLIELLGAKT